MNMHQRFREYKAEEVLYLDDFDEIIDISIRMQKECEPDIPFDESEQRSHMMTLLSDIQRENCNMWIVKHKGKIVGFAAAIAHKYMFSKAKIASLAFWYVTPPYRKSRVAFELFHTFEHWAKLIGVARIEVGASKSVGDTDNINRMFTKRGFAEYGALFYKHLGE